MPNPIRMPRGDTSGGKWTPLPAGTYDLRIKEIHQKVSSNGNPQLQVICEVADGPHLNKKVYLWWSLVPQAAWVSQEVLEALDIEFTVEDKDAEGNEIILWDADDLLERVVRYDATVSEYNNKLKNDFSKPQCSPLDAYYAEIVESASGEEQAQAPTPAPTPAPAPASAPAPAATTGRRRRRPAPAS